MQSDESKTFLCHSQKIFQFVVYIDPYSANVENMEGPQ
jgi:hypothetical protein